MLGRDVGRDRSMLVLWGSTLKTLLAGMLPLAVLPRELSGLWMLFSSAGEPYAPESRLSILRRGAIIFGGGDGGFPSPSNDLGNSSPAILDIGREMDSVLGRVEVGAGLGVSKIARALWNRLLLLGFLLRVGDVFRDDIALPLIELPGAAGGVLGLSTEGRGDRYCPLPGKCKSRSASYVSGVLSGNDSESEAWTLFTEPILSGTWAGEACCEGRWLNPR